MLYVSLCTVPIISTPNNQRYNTTSQPLPIRDTTHLNTWTWTSQLSAGCVVSLIVRDWDLKQTACYIEYSLARIDTVPVCTIIWRSNAALSLIALHDYMQHDASLLGRTARAVLVGRTAQAERHLSVFQDKLVQILKYPGTFWFKSPNISKHFWQSTIFSNIFRSIPSEKYILNSHIFRKQIQNPPSS